MSPLGHFPRGVTDPLCSQEHVIDTGTDRRLLWHLERAMPGWPRSDSLAATQRALAHYLHATCEHHWHDALACCEPRRDDCYPSHRQCLWCNTVDLIEENR